MSTYARVDGGVVQEVVDTPPGTPMLRDRYHPDVLASFVPVPIAMARRVVPGWVWDGASFNPPPAHDSPPAIRYIPVSLVRQRMEEAGRLEALGAVLLANPGVMVKVFSLEQGVDPTDPDARSLIMAAGGDPDIILA